MNTIGVSEFAYGGEELDRGIAFRDASGPIEQEANDDGTVCTTVDRASTIVRKIDGPTLPRNLDECSTDRARKPRAEIYRPLRSNR